LYLPAETQNLRPYQETYASNVPGKKKGKQPQPRPKKKNGKRAARQMTHITLCEGWKKRQRRGKKSPTGRGGEKQLARRVRKKSVHTLTALDGLASIFASWCKRGKSQRLTNNVREKRTKHKTRETAGLFSYRPTASRTKKKKGL